MKTIDILHSKGLLVVQDVVLNHVGYGDWATFRPFNQLTDYHDCNGARARACGCGRGPVVGRARCFGCRSA
jgi:pullulanase/glycogen debranching enzyme